MPTRQEYEKASLASGEVSQALHAATDLRAHQTGVACQENMVTVLEGVATRRPGTRFVLEAKDHTQRGKFWPFRYASGDYYMLAFNGGKMRVIRDAGYVVSGGVPYEISIPWTEAQLRTLRAAAVGGTLTFTAAGGRIRKITRVATDSWTIADYLPLNGPIEKQNTNKAITILPSGSSGAVTLVGSGGPFDVGMTGGVMRLDEANANLTALWQAQENVSQILVGLPAPSSLFGTFAPLANLNDASTATVADVSNVRSAYAGFRWTAGVKFSAITIYSPSGGFTSGSRELTLELWAKVGAAPANDTDGVMLARRLIADSSAHVNGVGLYSPDVDTTWNNIWFRLVSTVAVTFTVTEVFPQARGTVVPVYRRWGENIYEAASDGTAGSSPPIHDDGDASYGGVVWRFRSKIYGFVRIDAVTGVNAATGTVIGRLPDSALQTPTYRWWPPSWSDGLGWPDVIQQHQQKFLFTRKNRVWLTRPATVDDFRFTPDTDSAISFALTSPDGSLVEIAWAAASGIVVLGSADIEWQLRAPASNDVLQQATVDAVPDSSEGSAAQITAKVDRGIIFVGRTGKRLHYLQFDALTQKLAPEEISAAARHIFGAGIVATAWQKDPHKILWIVLSDGTLAACTFMPAQKIIAFHRHPMVNAFVEDIAALPALNDGRTEIYLWVRRTIAGQVRRYIEMLTPFFAPIDADAPTAEGAWFVDCGLRYTGVPVTTINGLQHLEGQEVAVFADGAMQSRKIVSAGAITLDADAANVVVGLPQTWRVTDLPRSLQMPGGSSRGKPQRANAVIIDVLYSASGKVRLTHPPDDRTAGPDNTPFDDLVETGADDYGSAIRLYSGQIAMTITSDSAAAIVTDLVGDDAMPFTLRAIVPDMIVEGD